MSYFRFCAGNDSERNSYYCYNVFKVSDGHCLGKGIDAKNLFIRAFWCSLESRSYPKTPAPLPYLTWRTPTPLWPPLSTRHLSARKGATRARALAVKVGAVPLWQLLLLNGCPQCAQCSVNHAAVALARLQRAPGRAPEDQPFAVRASSLRL